MVIELDLQRTDIVPEAPDPIQVVNDHFHRIGDVRALNGAISVVSMGHRTNDYRGLKLPLLFSSGRTMVVEHEKPQRIAEGDWIMSHDEVCHAHGIPVQEFIASSNVYITSGYVFQFKTDIHQFRYYFPSTGKYLSAHHIQKLQNLGITVVDEYYRIYAMIHAIHHESRVQKLPTIFTPREFFDPRKH